jgi:hypothetical protein
MRLGTTPYACHRLTCMRLVIALLVAVVLAACRSDKTQTAEELPDRAEAEAVTAAAVIRPADLPSGLVALPDGQKLDPEPLWAELVGCLKLGLPSDGQGSSTASATYGQGAARATSAVTYLTDSRAERITAALTGDEAGSCATQAAGGEIQRLAPPGGRAGPVRVASLGFPTLTKQHFAHRSAATVDAGGTQASMFLDQVVILDGNVITRMLFVNTGGPFPSELQGSFVERVASRT